MRAAGRNSYQKAAHRAGERRISRDQADELLALSRSDDAEDRLVAARFLCPCHVRGRTEDMWEAIVALMSDDDPRIRGAAWHTLEDGGVPAGDGVLERLEALLARETDQACGGLRRKSSARCSPSASACNCATCGGRNRRCGASATSAASAMSPSEPTWRRGFPPLASRVRR